MCGAGRRRRAGQSPRLTRVVPTLGPRAFVHQRLEDPGRARSAARGKLCSWTAALLYGYSGRQRHTETWRNVERETGFEPATSSLGSWHSTTELLPPRGLSGFRQEFYQKPGLTGRVRLQTSSQFGESLRGASGAAKFRPFLHPPARLPIRRRSEFRRGGCRRRPTDSDGRGREAAPRAAFPLDGHHRPARGCVEHRHL